MIAAYGRVLRAPGVPRVLAAFLAVGTAQTMTPVAFVLFARDATDSFASASLVLAASITGGLIFAPLRGRLVDRLGEGQAVLRLAGPAVATDTAFILTGRAGVPAGVLVAVAFVSGAVTAPVGAALRGMWSSLLPPDSRQAGYAVMTMMQEVTFFVGPLLAGGLIGLWSATAAVATAAGLGLAGAIAFATAPTALARGQRAPAERRFAALASRGTRTVLATAIGFGLAIGILDVALPAFARAHGSNATSGALLSAFAAGVGLGSLAYGLRSWGLPAHRQYPRLTLLAAAGLAPLVVAPRLGFMLALVFVAGLSFAPISNCLIAIIDDVSAPEHRAETFTWVGSVNGTGLALGAVIAGQLITSASMRAAFAAACGATLLAYLVAVTRARTLSPGG